MSALFVTSTGTEIGKTFVAVELVRALRSRGRAVHALKPVITGFDPDRAAESDTGRLLDALGQPLTQHAIEAVSPWRLAAPLSPDMAAAREGREIDWSALLAYCRRAIDRARSERDAVTLIEGIGGVMVPLDAKHTVLDWIAELRIPALLVAGSYLGTLSHTLTAAGMLAARGCTLAGVVVNESEAQPVPPEETAETLRRFLPSAPIVVVPRGGNPLARDRLASLVSA
ncbi:MAG: dethiobiotin synthase [Gammaproteobacteria bacterium]